MINIKEVEKRTGITKQNIRYYERCGLVHPMRNQENDYREYAEEDVNRLQLIKLFRKLDMPIEEIKILLDEEVKLADVLKSHKERLLKEKERLTDVLVFCNNIYETDIKELNADYYLTKMEENERKGAVFAQFLDDFKTVIRTESTREFRFMPDNMCRTASEFTEALLKYADEQKLNLIITKEGMYPEFTIDDVEYTAHRIFSRYGAVVICHMKNSEDNVTESVPKKRYYIFKLLWRIWIPLVVILLLILTRTQEIGDLLYLIPIGIGILILFMVSDGHFHNLKN